MTKTRVSIILVLIASAVYAASLFVFSDPKVILKNVAEQDIHNIHVEVTGRTYSVDTIKAGRTAKVSVQPTSDSHIVIYTENRKNEIPIDVYLGRHTTGSKYYLEITKDSLVSFREVPGIL